MRTADLNKILAKKLQLRWKLDFPPDVTWFFCLLLQNKLLLLLLEVSQESLHRYTHRHTRSVEEFACYSGGKCGIKQRFCRNTVMIMLCHVEDISALDNNKSNICS